MIHMSNEYTEKNQFIPKPWISFSYSLNLYLSFSTGKKKKKRKSSYKVLYSHYLSRDRVNQCMVMRIMRKCWHFVLYLSIYSNLSLSPYFVFMPLSTWMSMYWAEYQNKFSVICHNGAFFTTMFSLISYLNKPVNLE